MAASRSVSLIPGGVTTMPIPVVVFCIFGSDQLDSGVPGLLFPRFPVS